MDIRVHTRLPGLVCRISVLVILSEGHIGTDRAAHPSRRVGDPRWTGMSVLQPSNWDGAAKGGDGKVLDCLLRLRTNISDHYGHGYSGSPDKSGNSRS